MEELPPIPPEVRSQLLADYAQLRKLASWYGLFIRSLLVAFLLIGIYQLQREEAATP